jgi:nitrogen fixation protein FixH
VIIRHKGMAARPSRSLWLLFPWFIAAAMGVVIAVNCYMAWSALHTFPGNAGSDGFDLSNRYNAIIQRMKQEAGLGWCVAAQVDQAGYPVVILTDRSGTALTGAEIEATAQRPLGDPHGRQVRFVEVTAGHYRGDVALDEKGQWELEIWAIADGQEFSTTRRIMAQ